MAKILLAEDNEDFRKTVRDILEDCGYEVEEARDGREAQRKFDLHDFSLVISDVRMPEVDGLELLRWIKGRRPIPMILMTGFSELLETKQAYQAGADDFFSKPFELNDFLRVVKKQICKDHEKSTESSNLDGQYSRIRVELFVLGHEIPYGIFLRLSEKSYVKVAKEGEDVSLDVIKSYKDEGIHYLYLLKEDYFKYIGFNWKPGSTDVTMQARKQAFVERIVVMAFAKSVVDGIDKKHFQAAKDFVDMALSTLVADDEIFTLLEQMNIQSNSLFAHSLGVALYSVIILENLGRRAAPSQFKVVAGGLLHDIGTQKAQASNVEHVTQGFQLVSGLKTLPNDVSQIVFQHHENCLGTGYPRELTKEKIHPLARIVAVADQFCKYTMAVSTDHPLSVETAIAKLSGDPGIDQDALNALKKSFSAF